MSWTLCTSGAAIAKAGLNANSTIIASGATLAEFYDEVEGTINSLSRYDWTTNYASLGTNFKKILADCASDLIAMKIINYDMSGYTSRAEAQTMLDLLYNNSNKILNALEDDKFREVLI